MSFVHKYWAAVLFGVAAIVNIITCLVLWDYARSSNGVLPLHYNVVSGTDQVGRSSALYQLPVFGVASILLNGVIWYLFAGLGKYFAVLGAATSVFVACIILFASVLLKLHGL